MAFTYSDTAAQNDIIEQVERRADQVIATGQTVPINRKTTYLELVASMREVFQAAPENLVLPEALDGTADANTNGTDEGTFFKVPRPDDLIRFERIKLDDWARPVDDLVDRHSDLYMLQGNQYCAADKYHPLAALVSGAFELYPTSANADPVTEFTYIGAVAPEDVSDQLLKDAIIWNAAGRVLQVEHEQAVADQAYQAALRILEGKRHGLKGEELPQAE